LPSEQGKTLLVVAQVERRAMRRGASRQALVNAEALFMRSGAELCVQRARSDLQRAGLEPGPQSKLTPSEERIARLAASVLANREVATRLLHQSLTGVNLADARNIRIPIERADIGLVAAGQG
jgi:DNA-binding NarL/FixJ family response regulator